jgi:hypothetical protein
MEVIVSEEIFCGYGIRIFKREGHFYIEYDVGEIVVQMREVEVTEEEAQKAQRSEHDAYEVLMTK